MQHREHRTLVHNSTVQLHRHRQHEQQHEHLVVNISRGGLCFQSQLAYELNERLSLDVYVEKELIHHAEGRICYRNDAQNNTNQYGLSFLDHFIDNDLVRESHTHD